jgi:hypothetical protein
VGKGAIPVCHSIHDAHIHHPSSSSYFAVQRFGFVLFHRQEDADAAQAALQVRDWQLVGLFSLSGHLYD